MCIGAPRAEAGGAFETRDRQGGNHRLADSTRSGFRNFRPHGWVYTGRKLGSISEILDELEGHVPKINFSCFTQAGNYQGRWTTAYMAGGAALSTLQLGDLKYTDTMVKGRNILSGIDFQNHKASVEIDLNLETQCEYLHVNIFNDERTVIDKKKDKSQGSQNKGCVWCSMVGVSAASQTIRIAECSETWIDGKKVQKLASCGHPEKQQILQDVGRLLYRLFVGCIE